MIHVAPYKNPFETIMELRAQLAEAKRRGYEKGVKDGYLLGFNVSAEGWNGEYPFGGTNKKPEEDAYWLSRRAEVIERLLGEKK